ncbi:MAG: manganese efflux pump [Methanomicrobium sp.]|nr:manganese efflux pump [Methanomicrobium sp.]
MNLLGIFVIAVGLAMDAFAVSVSAGTMTLKDKLKTAAVLASAFGFFQALMPIIGWYAGTFFAWLIIGYAHFVAFILLAFIGAGMIKEGLSDDGAGGNDGNEMPQDFGKPSVVLLLAIATSIDALAVGISFAVLEEEILIPAIIIGIVTFVISVIGLCLGDKLSEKSRSKAEIFGGVILILVGLKILLENIVF